MITFNEISFLWLLLPLPFLFTLFLWLERNREKRNRAYISANQWNRLVNTKMGKWIKYLVFIPLVFIIIALAEPRVGDSLDSAEKASLDIVLAIDVSESMLAEDIYPNRLEALKRGIYAMLERLKGDRVALVAFAGNSYPQMPLTSDYGAVRLFLESFNPDMAPMKGTNINKAIEASMELFDEGEADNRTIFILSDGENHEDSALVAAKKAASKGVIINVASIGTREGAQIPVYRNGVLQGYKADKMGNTVNSAANPDFLSKVAAEGAGKFMEAKDPVSALLQLYKATDDMPRLPRENVEVRNKANRFLWLLWPSFAIMLWLFIRSKKWKFSNKGLLSIGFVLIPFLAYAQHPNKVFREGVSAYKNGDYNKAIEIFKQTQKNKELSTASKYNMAAAYYKAGKADSAINMVQSVAVSNDRPELQAKAWYNLGNAFLNQQNYAKAVESYAKSLKLDPNDENARYNLTYALKKLQQKQQQNQDQNQDQQKEKEQERKQEEKPLDKNNANEEVLKLLENKEKDKRKNSIPRSTIRPDKDW